MPKVLFQAIQFSISMQFSSIWPKDRILAGATSRARVDLGAISLKCYSAFPKAPALHKTSEEGQKMHRPKRFQYNNKDEDNSQVTLSERNHQGPSQKFWQIQLIRSLVNCVLQ